VRLHRCTTCPDRVYFVGPYLVRLLLADGALQEGPGHGGARAVAGVPPQPRRVTAQRVQEHGLRLRQRHAERRALLAE